MRLGKHRSGAGVSPRSSPSCSEDETTEAHIRLVVADKNLRQEGVECAGARPFQHIHAGAPFQVEGADGSVVFEGELPAGRARNAEPEIDWGVERIPTSCVLDFDVDVPQLARYQLRLGEGRPLDFRVSSRTGEPIEFVVG
jgi:hypothetical protein